MFDQKQSSSAQSSSTNGTQSPSVSNSLSSSSSKEPEDIFSQTNPVKKQSISAASSPVHDQQQSISQNNQASVPSSSDSSSDEPAFKSPPSVFKKINSVADNRSTVPNQVTSMPYTQGTGQKKIKIKIIIIGVIFICLIIIASMAFWYFNRSSSNQESVTPAETAKLFNQPTNQANSAVNKNQDKSSAKPAAETDKSDVPKDTDGDGLSDEEEAVLGTSLTSPDTDNDGLFDKEEVKVYKTDPLKADTDGDGYTDGEEVKNNFNPLQADQDKHNARDYQNVQYKFKLTLPENMVFEAQQNNIVRFNDNVNQIKLYIYINNSQPKDLTPDIAYTINEDAQGNLIITHQQSLPDKTPFSTDLSTNAYHARNGLIYLVRYVATKRAPDHAQKFESILRSFKFVK